MVYLGIKDESQQKENNFNLRYTHTFIFLNTLV